MPNKNNSLSSPVAALSLFLVGMSDDAYQDLVDVIKNSGPVAGGIMPRHCPTAEINRLAHCNALSDTGDLILVLDGPEFDVLALMHELKAHAAHVPVIVLVEGIALNRVVELMKAGVKDCITQERRKELCTVILKELRKAQAQAVERSEMETSRLLARACRAAGRPIVIADNTRPDRPVIFANEAFQKLSGYTAAEIIGKNCRLLQGTERSQPERHAVRNALDHGNGCEATMRNFRKDGSLFYNHCIIRPLKNANDKVTHFVGVQSDVTEIKMNEERFRRALHYEQEMNQMKSDFVTMVSHEFRTPLGVINSSAHILQRYAERMSVAERGAQIQEIRTAVTRMTSMMEDLLLFGKLEALKMECLPGPVDIRLLSSQVIHDLERVSEGSRTIACRIQDPIGMLNVDGMLVRHILTNLLSNALKYSDPGQEVLLEVRTKTETELSADNKEEHPTEWLTLLVKDQGIGIPAPDKAKLFHAFHRSTNVGSRPGTGMGLAITKRCVDLHGGRIQVESTVGKGTSFTISLPLASTQIHPTGSPLHAPLPALPSVP